MGSGSRIVKCVDVRGTNRNGDGRDMTTADTLENIRQRALSDNAFRKSLLDSRKAEDPVSSFCRICREHGFTLYDMDVIALGEEEHAAMKRSTNGGGENSPMLEGQDDYFDLFLMDLEALD